MKLQIAIATGLFVCALALLIATRDMTQDMLFLISTAVGLFIAGLICLAASRAVKTGRWP